MTWMAKMKNTMRSSKQARADLVRAFCWASKQVKTWCTVNRRMVLTLAFASKHGRQRGEEKENEDGPCTNHGQSILDACDEFSILQQVNHACSSWWKSLLRHEIYRINNLPPPINNLHASSIFIIFFISASLSLRLRLRLRLLGQQPATSNQQAQSTIQRPPPHAAIPSFPAFCLRPLILLLR